MFNLFNRKEPEKPNFQGEQHDHEQRLIVFEGTSDYSRYDEFKDQYKKHFIVKIKHVNDLTL